MLTKGDVVRGTVNDFMANSERFVGAKGTFWVDAMSINLPDGEVINAQTLSLDKKSEQQLEVWELHEFKIKEFSKNTYTLDWIKPVAVGKSNSNPPAASNELSKTAILSARSNALSSAVNFCNVRSKEMTEPFVVPPTEVSEVLEIAEQFLNWIKQ